MATRKFMVLIAIAFAAFVLVGCSQGSETITINDPYLGGSEGLVIEFEPMAPEQDGVQTIFDDEGFNVDIRVRNKGEFGVQAGTLRSRLVGISPSDYTGLSFDITNERDIEKISEFNQAGGEENLDHGTGRIVQSRIKDRNLLTATIFAEVAYPYKTFISAPKVCFKDVSARARENEICDVDTSLQVFSSGAPIRAVSAVESRSGKGLISVKFVISNDGSGESKQPTNPEFDYRYNEIAFTVQESSSPEKWTCTSAGRDGVGRFRDDSTIEIICRLKDQYQIQSDEVYQSQLDLALEYDYRVRISNDLVIRNNDI